MGKGIDIKGLDKVEQKLKKLGRRTAKKVVKKGVTKGAKPLLKAARAKAPRDTGRLRRAIKSRVMKKTSRDEAGRLIMIDPGKSRDDTKGAWYGYIINNGWIDRSGTYHPGKKFMEAAYEKEKKNAANSTVSEIESGIMREANK